MATSAGIFARPAVPVPGIASAPMRDTLLTIHIIAAGTWLGANVVRFLLTPQLQRAGGTVAARWHRNMVGLLRTLYMPAAVLALLTGVGLVTSVDNSPYEMSDLFVSIGFLTVVVGSALGMAFFAPNGRRAADARESGDDTLAASIENKLLIGGVVDTALVIVTIAVMVGKWGV